MKSARCSSSRCGCRWPNVVGRLNQGWTCAKALLGHERFNAGKIGRSLRELALLKRLASEPDALGRRLLNDVRFAERIAAVEVDLLALEQTTLRLMAAPRELAPAWAWSHPS